MRERPRQRVHTAIGTRQPSRIAMSLRSVARRNFCLRLGDGRTIESVFIPDTPAMTFCLSTQVGCAIACAFCLTGKMGLVRNLTAGEIVGRSSRCSWTRVSMRKVRFNLVLMGMGEPLHNYDDDDEGAANTERRGRLRDPPRRITLSTVGLLPGARKAGARPIAAEPGDFAARANRRAARRCVPINAEVRESARSSGVQRFPLRKRRSRITFST